MKMLPSYLKSCALLATLLFATSAAAGPIPGQVDDFESGSTSGWSEGGSSDNPPKVEDNGGPDGIGDAWLEVESDGGSGAGSKMAFFNRSQWSGDWSALGEAPRLEAFLSNPGTRALAIRIGLEMAGGDGTRWVSTAAIALPAGAGWTRSTFDVSPSAMTRVSGTRSLAEVLAAVGELRILSRESGPAWTGDAISAKLGVDDFGVPAAAEPHRRFVAAAARAAGAGGSLWRTSLGLLNAGSAPTTATITLRRAGGVSSSTTTTVAARSNVLLDDIVGTILAGADGVGSLEVVSDLPLDVASRTYNLSSTGTFGQYIDGISVADTLPAGGAGRLMNLREDEPFRTNLGFVNLGSTDATISVVLHDDSGAALPALSFSVPPGEQLQVLRPFRSSFNRSDIVAGWAEVQLVSGSDVWGYASVVDNATGDPTTIPLKK